MTLTLNHHGLRGALSANFNGMQLANGRVYFGRKPEACIDIAILDAVFAFF